MMILDWNYRVLINRKLDYYRHLVYMNRNREDLMNRDRGYYNRDRRYYNRDRG